MKFIHLLLGVLFIIGCAAPNHMVQKQQSQSNQVVNSLGMAFVKIEPGRFKMGIPEDAYGHSSVYTPVHEVNLTKGFLMQTTEVTQKQWKQVMGENPSRFTNCNNCPAESVSFDEVKTFIKKFNKMENTTAYRLPTDAEWEYACRANTQTNFFYGQCLYSVRANFNSLGRVYLGKETCRPTEFRQKTIPVGSFAPNKWGLYDMHGNVAEWCEDYFQPLETEPSTDPIMKEGSLRIIRGGGWKNPPIDCLSGYRKGEEPDTKASFIGFRLVKSISVN